MPNNDKGYLDYMTSKITAWIGSIESIVAHTVFFVIMIALVFLGVDLTQILLVLTTIVSLEAIYLSIFIQYTVNQHNRRLSEVTEEIKDVAEDVEEIAEGVEEVSEEVQDISKDVEEISDNLEELEEDNNKSEVVSPTYERLENQLQLLLNEVRHLKQESLKSSTSSYNNRS